MLKNFFIVVSIAVLTACNSDSIMEISTIEKPITKTVVVDFNAMLSFATEDDMYAEINKLKNMNCDELSAWRSSHADFISQFDFMNAVVDELDAAQSIEEVRDIQAKYSDRLLFDTNYENEDIAPYIPTNNNGTELVCNSYGNVKIGGEVKNYNEITSCEQSNEYRKVHSEQSATRGHVFYTGTSAATKDRKCWIDMCVYNNTIVEIKLNAHKKGVFGWNKYKTAYYLRLYEVSNWITKYDGVRIINEVSPNFYKTADVASGTYIQLVSGVQNMQYNNGLTGIAKIVVGGYSRGVGAENFRITGLACVAKKKIIIVDTRGEEIEQIVDDGEEVLPIDQSELENYL